MPMDKILELMAEKRASDLFIAVGTPIQMKVNGTTVPINQTKLESGHVEGLLREVIADRHWQMFVEDQELNVGYGLRGIGSFRLSLFRQRGTTAAVVRYIPGDVPSFDTLGLPPVLTELILQKRGLILVVGATGSGKTTTLASLIDYRNEQRTGHILTLEDPIEFVFKNKRSIVNQRQIGTDTADLRTALKNALRQAPDCILIGEIRDVETMGAAIAYAQSGHLVLATLHANSSSHALNRIVSFYSPENRRVLLSDLSTTLRAVVSQRLLRAQDGGRVPAVEVLLNTSHVAELIEQGRIADIKDAMVKSMTPGSQTFDQALIELIRSGRVSREDALANSDSPTNLLWLLDNMAVEAASPPTSIDALSLPPDLREAAAAATGGGGVSPAAPRAAPASSDPFQRTPKPEDSPTEQAQYSGFLLNI
ncbi:MAG: PilT/PilU family type 4a pilus ATPase [Lautropia sp.]